MIRPEVVVISNGSSATYHHPRAVTLETFRDRGMDIYHTNRYTRDNSRGRNVSDPSFILGLDPAGADGAIIITVRDAAGEYEVRNTRTGQTRAYPIQRPGH